MLNDLKFMHVLLYGALIIAVLATAVYVIVGHGKPKEHSGKRV